MKRSAIFVSVLAAGLVVFGGLAATSNSLAAKQVDTVVREVVFDYDDNKVIVNGKAAELIYPMRNVNGRIYVAARQIAEVFGFTAEWDPKSYDAVLRSEDTRIHVNQTAKIAYVNDMPQPFEGLGFVDEGRLLLSIRAIADYMGLYVGYDPGTQQAIVADASYPYVNSVDKKKPGFVPIDFRRFTQYPIADPMEQRDVSRALIFSDSPEVFNDYGVLYRDTLKGKARLYLLHVNGLSRQTATVNWIATNNSNRAVTITVTRQGAAPKSKDYAAQGRTALVNWFTSGDEDRKTFVIQPNSSQVLYRSDELKYYEAAHAIFDVESDGEVQYDVIAADPSKADKKIESMAFLQRDVHDRGTYPISDIKLQVDAGDWERNTPVRIRIGEVGSLTEHWVTGKDAVTGEASQNFGNYGVFYELTVTHPGKAAYVLVPLRGHYRGAAVFDGEAVQTDTLYVEQGHLLGRTDGTESEVKLQLGASSGSYMPFEVLVYPLE